jgi:S-formylglutathione hydrolase FrmB
MLNVLKSRLDRLRLTNQCAPATSTSRFSRSAAALVFLVVLGVPSAALAHEATGTCAEVMDPHNAPSTDPRIEHISVAGTHVNVLLPPHYHQDHSRRYPVLYLFHGAFSDEDSFSTQTNVLAFTASQPEHLQAIVVMPDGGRLPAGRDWVDGAHPQETYVIKTLVPYIDTHYRTLGDGAHRAGAGFSGGALDAAVYAARHPGLFAAVGSFSGFLDPFDSAGIDIVHQFVEFDDDLCGGTVGPNDIWGDPDMHPMGWTGHDPVYLARNLHGVSVYISSANGIPCGDQFDSDPFLSDAENAVYAMSLSFDQALTDAGVAHTTKFRSCGIHQFSNSNQSLAEFWPQMFQAFGRTSPHEFNYRTSDVSASVRDWSFDVSGGRAPEFLDITGASDHGLSLTGSGMVHVTTASLFGKHELVVVSGLGGQPRTLRADSAGRISFDVTLKAPHLFEQFTAPELAAEAADPHYFATRNVVFSRPFRGDGGSGCGHDGDDDHDGHGHGYGH